MRWNPTYYRTAMQGSNLVYVVSSALRTFLCSLGESTQNAATRCTTQYAARPPKTFVGPGRCLVAVIAFAIGRSVAQIVARAARVVGLSRPDGDTITVLDTDKRQHKIRINGIDAPEKGQAFGERSRQSLAQMTHGKDARLECHKTDRFAREVCKVWVQPLDCLRCGRDARRGPRADQRRASLVVQALRRRAVGRGPRPLRERGGRSSLTEARAVGG